MGRTQEQHVAQYVDSHLLAQRLHSGSRLVARVYGTPGVYRVDADTRARSGSCMCPSDEEPCKHIDALLKGALAALGVEEFRDHYVENEYDGE